MKPRRYMRIVWQQPRNRHPDICALIAAGRLGGPFGRMNGGGGDIVLAQQSRNLPFGDRPLSTKFAPFAVLVGIQLPDDLSRRDNFATSDHRTEISEEPKSFARVPGDAVQQLPVLRE